MTTATVGRVPATHALTEWLNSLGLHSHVASIVVEHAVSAELVGRRSHGLRLLPSIARAVARSSTVPDDVTAVVREAGTLIVEASGLPGIYAMHRAIDELIGGHDQGRLVMSASVVRYTGTTGCLGLYTNRIAEAGLTGLVLATSPAIIAAPGGFRPVLGTNAVSFGAPAGAGHAIVGDFASSERTYGDIALARAQGASVPLGVMLDEVGRPTDDPSAIVEGSLLPSAGHRGWCQALLVELLAGALTGGKVGRGAGGDSALVLSFRPDAFEAMDAAAAAADLIEQIQSHGSAPGHQAPHIPGDRFAQLRRPQSDLEVGLETLRRIEAIGGPALM